MPLILPTPLTFNAFSNTNQNADDLAKLAAQINNNIDDLNEALTHITNLPLFALYSTDIAPNPNNSVYGQHHNPIQLTQKYLDSLSAVSTACQTYLNCLKQLVLAADNPDWKNFSEWEKQLCENTVLLASLLSCLCAAPNRMNSTELAAHIDATVNILNERFGGMPA